MVAGGRTLAVTGSSEPGAPVTRTLTVTKDVVPDGGATFSFTVDCVHTALPGTNGDATFSLGDGGVAVFTGIADDDQCAVVEATPATGTWATTTDGDDTSEANVSLADGNATVAFVNHALHTLTVVKDVVSPTQAESTQFTVDCGPYVLSTANNPSVSIAYLNGDAMFTAADLGSTAFSRIPTARSA